MLYPCTNHWFPARCGDHALPVFRVTSCAPLSSPSTAWRWLQDRIASGDHRIEQGGVDGGIGDAVGELVAQAGAVGEVEFAALECGIGDEDDEVDLGHPAPGGGRSGPKGDAKSVVGGGGGEEFEALVEFGAVAGEAGFDEGEGVLPGAGACAGQGVEFGAVQSGIKENEAVLLADGDGARGIAEFPAEVVGDLEPDAAGGGDRLGEGLEGARLDHAGGPGLDVGPGGEPGGKEVIGGGPSGRGGTDEQGGDGCGQPPGAGGNAECRMKNAEWSCGPAGRRATHAGGVNRPGWSADRRAGASAPEGQMGTK